MKLFRSKFTNVMEVINNSLTQDLILKYNISIEGRFIRGFFVDEEKSIKEELTSSFTGTSDSSERLLSLNSVAIYPQSILKICKENKISDYRKFTKVSLNILLRKLENNISPYVGLEEILMEMV